MHSSSQRFVRFLIEQGALIRPEGPLHGGKRSPYMINFGVCSTGPILEVFGAAYDEKSMELGGIQVYFGPAYKGVFIASAITSFVWKRHQRDVGFASSRKEVKDHGEGGLLLGASIRTRCVCIVDDVLTEGDSLRAAAQFVESEGGVLVGCVVGFDRQERARCSQKSVREELSRELNVPVLAIASLNDLEVVLSHRGDPVAVPYYGMLSDIRRYKSQYCVT